jgi:hypothetical protein
MASGHVEPHLKAEHMAAPTNAAYVKKALANSEPSTHGTKQTSSRCRLMSAFGATADIDMVEFDETLFGFLTTDANDVVGAIHPKALPVILTTPLRSSSG